MVTPRRDHSLNCTLGDPLCDWPCTGDSGYQSPKTVWGGREPPRNMASHLSRLLPLGSPAQTHQPKGYCQEQALISGYRQHPQFQLAKLIHKSQLLGKSDCNGQEVVTLSSVGWAQEGGLVLLSRSEKEGLNGAFDLDPLGKNQLAIPPNPAASIQASGKPWHEREMILLSHLYKCSHTHT